MDEGRGSLQRLNQIGLQGVLQKSGHGALRLQVVSGDGLPVIGVGHHHPSQPGFQVGDVRRKAQHRHDLAGHGDIKAVLPRNALHPASQTVHNVAELAVVHVHRPLPCDLLGVNAQRVALLNVIIQHGGQQVVGRADGVEIAGEMEVDVLHRHHLRVAAAGCAALDAEHRPQRGFPEGGNGVFAQPPQAVGQTDGGGGLALACGRGIDGRHQNQLAVRALAVP